MKYSQWNVSYVAREGYRINHKLFIEIEAARWKSLGGVDGDVQHGWKLELSSTMQLRLLRHAINPSECSSRLIKIQFQGAGDAVRCGFKDIFHEKLWERKFFKLESRFLHFVFRSHGSTKCCWKFSNIIDRKTEMSTRNAKAKSYVTGGNAVILICMAPGGFEMLLLS